MSKAAFDAKLAALDALKSAGDGPERDAALAKGLADRNNYIAAKAARVAGEVNAREVIPQLETAFERFLTNPAKTDPQCQAKIAIAKALSALDYQEPDLFLRGLHHFQPEPVWGGQQDTAGPLRSNCAMALLGCRTVSDPDALEYLLEVLTDPDPNVRADAARAVGQIDRREAALLLRLRALQGDTEPQPLGAVYSALLAIERTRAIPFVARFLEKGGEAAGEAALALASTHEAEAFVFLRAALDGRADSDLRSTFLAAIALTRLPEAIEFLLELADGGSREALRALSSIPLTDEVRERVAVIERRR